VKAEAGAGPLLVVARGALGLCVLATRSIAAGVMVDRFQGPEMSYAEVPEDEVRYVISFAPYRWLIPEPPSRFLNHSCEPNCRVLPAREVVTCRPVVQGEELTIAYDYADAEDVRRHPDHYFWDPRWTFTCACRSPRCRGVIDRYRPT
jgi:hypothetical protein